MKILFIIILLVAAIATIYLIYQCYRSKTLNDAKEEAQLERLKEFEEATAQFKQQAIDLKAKIEKIEQEYITSRENYVRQKQKFDDDIAHYKEKLNSEKQIISTLHCSELEKLREECEQQKKNIQAEVAALNSSLQARLEAARREQEIKENKENYCLTLSLDDENDIKVLEGIKSKLHSTRTLSKLIWSDYFQKPLTTLCNKLIGTTTKSGIYKITNQITGECYIGQSLDLSSRWKEHAKYGLGIDTPDGNKFYKNIQEYGLQNFSWEVLEECKKEELDEKEAYYIELYQSKEYGLNTLAGRNVKKK